MSDAEIINALKNFDEEVTRAYFYAYCRRAYNIYDSKYQLCHKTGLDFYSLAHDYYLHLLKFDFKPLTDKPQDIKLTTWMMKGFHFVVLDALKAYNKEFEHQAEQSSDVVLEYVRTNPAADGMLYYVSEAVASHYHDIIMSDIARMIFYEGYKQKEVAEKLGITPAAVNQRYKKMMDDVVAPFIIENYGMGIEPPTYSQCTDDRIQFYMESQHTNITPRVTPDFITHLKADEIFVFGSNLQGIHAGGAARTARENFGAVMGQGVGLQGQSYAIPTMQGGPETIQPYVDEFIAFAKHHSDKTFLVTPIGCGIAGFTPEDIAPLFAKAKKVQNITLPSSFWDML